MCKDVTPREKEFKATALKRRFPGLSIMEPTTVGSLWLENDLHENELEFESYMGRSKKRLCTSNSVFLRVVVTNSPQLIKVRDLNGCHGNQTTF